MALRQLAVARPFGGLAGPDGGVLREGRHNVDACGARRGRDGEELAAGGDVLAPGACDQSARPRSCAGYHGQVTDRAGKGPGGDGPGARDLPLFFEPADALHPLVAVGIDRIDVAVKRDLRSLGRD